MFDRYQTDPEYRAHVQLWGLVGFLWFLLLLALTAFVGELQWLLTGIVLVIVMSAVSIVRRAASRESFTRSSWWQTVLVLVGTAVVTVALSQWLQPESTMTEHFTALLNPYWTLLILLWAAVRLPKSDSHD